MSDVQPGAVRAGRGGDMPRVSPKARTSMLVPRIVSGSLFVAVMVLIAAVAAWPIYRSGAVLLLAGVASIVAAGIAVIAWRRRWPSWLIALVLLGAFFVFGVPLAVPARLGGFGEFVRGLGELATGAVFGWKDLLTVDLPVGSYRNLLVPALVIFLVGTCVALLLSWRDDKVAYAAAPVSLGMVSFGLFFGRTSVSGPWQWGPLTLYAPVETAIGVSALVGCLLWLAWRSRDERVRALQRAAASSGVRVTRRPSRADQRRGALGAGMIVVAVVATAIVVPFAARDADRAVLRSAVAPEIDLSAEVSPLTSYRSLFEDEMADQVMFTVTSAGGALPDRVRLATLDNYDGEIFRAGGSDSVDASRFVRVPSTLDAGEGAAASLQISIDALNGIWLPTAGQLQRVDFTGDRSAALADRFYYSAAAQSGVETAAGGVAAGDTYRVTAVVPNEPDLATVEAPGSVSETVAAPENLRKWVDENIEGSDGAALAGLVTLLRDRGYLSHGLADPTQETPVWAQELGEYNQQPSASGHSLARIDTMFAKLLERESDPRAIASENFVAAIGDDEQFSVAVALIAREVGFPSRVVVGARLSTDEPGLRTCEAGACRAQDMVAWTEVQSAGGDWVPVDVTPQYTTSPSLDVTEQRDPEVVTEVRPDNVEEVVPPEPVQEDSAADDDGSDDTGLDLAWLWPILRITGVVLLLLAIALGPFLIIALAKSARRRSRRRQSAPAARVAGGWDEYVDAAVDAGRIVEPSLTRGELAASFETPAGDVLAAGADRAVFSDASVSADDADTYWRAVEDERRALAHETTFWRRLAAAVSLRSFVRHLAPAGGARKRFAERGKRRAIGSVRTSQ